MAIRQRKDGRWCVYGRPGFWPDEPTRTMEYFGRGTAAEQAARRRNDELGGAKIKPLKRKPPGPTFAELAAEYVLAKQFSPKSHRELTIRLEQTILPAIGHLRANMLTHDDIDRYVRMRRATKANRKKTFIRDSTIRREITDIKAVLNWAVKRVPPSLLSNPISTFKPPASDDTVIMPPTEEEIRRILNAASEHLRRAILLSYYLGLRPGAVELLSLTWSAVSFDRGCIRVMSAHKGGPRFRDVPIHPRLRPLLKLWYKADKKRGPMIHYHGKPITKIQKSWEGALARAKITRRLRPYDLRHGYITAVLERGGDIGALSGVVGSRPETLRRHYQHVSDELTRRTVELVPGLDFNDHT